MPSHPATPLRDQAGHDVSIHELPKSKIHELLVMRSPPSRRAERSKNSWELFLAMEPAGGPWYCKSKGTDGSPRTSNIVLLILYF